MSAVSRAKNKITIKSAKDIFEIIEKHHNNRRLLFRGQNVDKPLLPRFARRAKELGLSNPLDCEKQMFDAFKKQSLPYLDSPMPETDWDRLAIAQHHGLPTRLLDWTTNSFAGLWFAVGLSVREVRDDGVLWVLEPDPKDLKSPSDETDIFDLRRTFIFQPSHVTKQIAAQSGWFSVHRYVEDKNRFIALELNKIYKDKVTKYKIPNSFFGQIRNELRLMGFTRATMFPDLAGLCDELQAEFLQSC